MKKLTLLLFLLGCSVQLSFAQPGFLGRKNLIRYDCFLMPANLLTLRNAGKFRLNNSHEFGYERIVSRRHVVGVNAVYLNLANRNVDYPLLPDPTGYITRFSGGIGIHAKLYPFLRKGWLAPLGPYMRLSISFNREVSTWHSESGLYADRPWEAHFYNSYSLGFGYSEIFFERMLVDFGMRFAGADLMHAVAGGGNTPARVYHVAEDILQSELIKLHIGVGFLL
ncbi:MAG: hypothetical protein RLZZ519_1970 [Bacteroidota bacterium]|jgi:hypothetical protein